jgi:excisionase family DNA binding protein
VEPQLPNNENDQNPADADGCSVCGELLANLGRFLEMLEAVRDSHRSDWLTVDEIAQELKLSKSIVYRLIRNGELEAVDLVPGDEGGIHPKGHFRISRSALHQYLEAKKVRPLPSPPTRLRPSRRFPKVKNHLRL